MSKSSEDLLARSPYILDESKSTGERNKYAPVISSTSVWLARISLGAAILFTPFRTRFVLFEISYPSIYSDYTNGLFFLADFFLILTLIFWAVDLLASPRKISPGPLAITIPMLGLLVASMISVIFSIVPAISVYHFIRMLVFLVFYFYLVNELHNLDGILVPIAAATAIQSIVAIIQVLKQQSVGLQALGEYILNPAWSGISIVYAEGIRTLRAYGLSDHPNILGGCLAFSLVLLISWQAMKKNDNRPVRIAIILVGLVGLLLTFSRSAWLSFILGISVVVILMFSSRRYLDLFLLLKIGFAGLIILSPFLVYASPYLGVRLNQANSFKEVENETRALQERSALNAAGNEVFVSSALTGVGIGASPIALSQHKPVFPYYYQPPHNTFLDAAVETGIFGAMFYGLLIISPWLLMLLRRKNIDFSPPLIAATGALMAVTVVGFFDYYTWLLVPGRFWQYLIWGIWGSIYMNSQKLKNND